MVDSDSEVRLATLAEAVLEMEGGKNCTHGTCTEGSCLRNYFRTS